MRRVTASAPARIDLAGGTLDLWPLYLLHEGAVTVNVAIDLRARVEAASRAGGRVHLISRDRAMRVTRPAGRPVSGGDDLELLARLAMALGPADGLELISDCEAPSGSGLGGSSALAIAAAAALVKLAGRRLAGDSLISLVRDLETRVLGIPAGTQDYYPALFGGAAALHLEPGRIRRERIALHPGGVYARLVLCDSGRSRSSGASNWDMMRRRLSGEAQITRRMAKIAAASRDMHAALKAGDWDAAGEALGAENAARRGLSPLVETDRIRDLIAAGHRAGAIAGKVCGAGGGGCIVFIVKADRREAVEAALRKKRGKILPVRMARRGLVWEKGETPAGRR